MRSRIPIVGHGRNHPRPGRSRVHAGRSQQPFRSVQPVTLTRAPSRTLRTEPAQVVRLVMKLARVSELTGAMQRSWSRSGSLLQPPNPSPFFFF